MESNETLLDEPKPLHYAINSQRFASFADKIVHVLLDTDPDDKSSYWCAVLQPAIDIALHAHIRSGYPAYKCKRMMSLSTAVPVGSLKTVASCRTVGFVLIVRLAWHLVRKALTCCLQEMAAAGGEGGGRE